MEKAIIEVIVRGVKRDMSDMYDKSYSIQRIFHPGSLFRCLRGGDLSFDGFSTSSYILPFDI